MKRAIKIRDIGTCCHLHERQVNFVYGSVRISPHADFHFCDGYGHPPEKTDSLTRERAYLTYNALAVSLTYNVFGMDGDLTVEPVVVSQWIRN